MDAVACISLRDREDRTREAAAQLHRVGLCRRVEFYRPARPPNRPKEAIWESHRTVLRRALDARRETVLVFEDDVAFRPGLTRRRLDSVREAFGALPKGWTVFYLGHWPIELHFLRHNLVRTRSACTHAYVASRALMEWLVATPYSSFIASSGVIGKGLDAAYAALAGTYAHFPMLAVQSTSPGDHKARTHGGIRAARHLVTRTRLHDYLLSHLMRPAELWAAAVSPLRTWREPTQPPG